MMTLANAQYIVRITDGEYVWYWLERGEHGARVGHGICDRAQASRVTHARASGLIEYLSPVGGFARAEETTVTMVRV